MCMYIHYVHTHICIYTYIHISVRLAVIRFSRVYRRQLSGIHFLIFALKSGRLFEIFVPLSKILLEQETISLKCHVYLT